MSEHQYKGRSSGRRPYSRPNGRHSQSSSKSSNGGQRNRNHSHSDQKRRQGNKKPIGFWKKLLNFFGIGKSSPKKSQDTKKAATTPVKTNTRVARTQESRQKKTPKMPAAAPRLYVGNLSYEATESDIEDLFKGVGSVRSVEIIYNPRTHKSKGYAFVEMRLMDDARRAVEVLHEQPFMGRELTVSAANERDMAAEESFSRSPRMEEREDETGAIEETITPLIAEEDSYPVEEKKEELA